MNLTLEANYTYNGKKYTATDGRVFTVSLIRYSYNFIIILITNTYQVEIEPLISIVDAAQRTAPIDSLVVSRCFQSFIGIQNN